MADTPDFTLLTTLNRCDGKPYYFKNVYGYGYGEVGEFFCYNEEVYEITALGGGGTINIAYPSFYPDYDSAYAVCPCGLYPGGEENCQETERISEYFYFYVDGNCSVGSQQVMFLNTLGTYDVYTFRAREDVGYDVNKQEYKQAPPLYSDGWNEISYYGWEYETKVWNNKQSRTGILHTGYIPKSDADWLTEELLRSPRVFLVDKDGDLYPIILTNSEVIKPNFQIPGQVNVVIEYKGAYPEVRQNK
jgi:hypothetical protein